MPTHFYQKLVKKAEKRKASAFFRGKLEEKFAEKESNSDEPSTSQKRPRKESYQENSVSKKTNSQIEKVSDKLEKIVIGDQVCDWTNIHYSLANQFLINSWKILDFTFAQTQDWANCFDNEFNPHNLDFYCWLRDIKQLTAQVTLNYADLTQNYSLNITNINSKLILKNHLKKSFFYDNY